MATKQFSNVDLKAGDIPVPADPVAQAAFEALEQNCSRCHQAGPTSGQESFGRGGADGTAAVVGAALGVDEIEIWTETDGMMTVDPRLAAGAKVIPQVSPEEAAELAYFGTKVLHPVMIRPALERGIPVRVLDTREPGSAGTLVSPQENLGPSGPCAVVHRGGITVLLISQPRMLMASGFLARVFEVFDRHHTPIDLIATSEVSVSLTVDNVEQLPAIKAELARLGEVRILREMAIVALVGRGFFRYAGLAHRIFDALADVNVVMISFAASDVNISVVVEEPAVAVVPATSVYVVTDPSVSYDMFRFGATWYLYSGGYWYRSSSHRGPFAAVDVRSVPREVVTVEPHLSAHRGGARQQPQDGARQHGLAAAGLADDAERAPRLQREIDAIHRPQVAARRRQLDRDVLDRQQRAAHNAP